MKTDSRGSQFNDLPKPGDFELGSLQSRAAARALHQAKTIDDQEHSFRVIVSVIGRPTHLEAATCERSWWPDGTLFELVRLGGGDSPLIEAQLERFIRKVPIDGKEYTGAEVGY